MKKLNTLLKTLPVSEPRFVDPMQCKLVSTLPVTKEWIYELKFDGYRAIAIKNGKDVNFISRNGKNLNRRYPELVAGLRELKVDVAELDGEIVVLDENGIPSFQRLQDLRAGERDRSLHYYSFDLLNYEKRDLRRLPLVDRKSILQTVLRSESLIRYAAHLDSDGERFAHEVRKLGLEGVVAKRIHSLYEAGKRSGAWVKFKVENEQEFVVGGYRSAGTPNNFDILLIGYYEGSELRYAAKLRAGFTPHKKREIASRFPKLITKKSPFSHLPVGRGGRWGEGLTEEDLQKVVWLKPRLVLRVKFVEWTSHANLRHAKFVAIRDDKNPGDVIREGSNF